LRLCREETGTHRNRGGFGKREDDDEEEDEEEERIEKGRSTASDTVGLYEGSIEAGTSESG